MKYTLHCNRWRSESSMALEEEEDWLQRTCNLLELNKVFRSSLKKLVFPIFFFFLKFISHRLQNSENNKGEMRKCIWYIQLMTTGTFKSKANVPFRVTLSDVFGLRITKQLFGWNSKEMCEKLEVFNPFNWIVFIYLGKRNSYCVYFIIKDVHFILDDIKLPLQLTFCH